MPGLPNNPLKHKVKIYPEGRNYRPAQPAPPEPSADGLSTILVVNEPVPEQKVVPMPVHELDSQEP